MWRRGHDYPEIEARGGGGRGEKIGTFCILYWEEILMKEFIVRVKGLGEITVRLLQTRPGLKYHVVIEHDTGPYCRCTDNLDGVVTLTQTRIDVEGGGFIRHVCANCLCKSGIPFNGMALWDAFDDLKVHMLEQKKPYAGDVAQNLEDKEEWK